MTRAASFVKGDDPPKKYEVFAAVFDMDPAVVRPLERVVLLALAWHANIYGRNAYPSVNTLRRKTSLARRSVQKMLRHLEKKGFIYAESSEPRYRRSVQYAINLDEVRAHRWDSAAAGNPPSSQPEPGMGAPGAQSLPMGAPGAHPGCIPRAEPAHAVRGEGAPGAPDLYVNLPEPLKEQQTAAERRTQTLERAARETVNALGFRASSFDLREDYLKRTHELDVNAEEDWADILYSVVKEAREQEARRFSSRR